MQCAATVLKSFPPPERLQIPTESRTAVDACSSAGTPRAWEFFIPDDDNLGPQARKTPASTTDEVLRMLSEQSAPSNGDDLLDNPELERLFGSLSQGLDEGLPEGSQATGVLTLEELVLGEPPAPATRESVVCSACGSRNPAATRFCG